MTPLPDCTLPPQLMYLPYEWRETILAFLTHMFENHSHSAKTVQLYRLLLKQFFSTCVTNHPEAMTRRDVENFLNSPVQVRAGNRGIASDGTKNMRQCVVSSLYKFAAYYLNRPIANPTLGKVYAKRQRLGRKRAFTDEELRAFFNVIPHNAVGLRDHCLYLVYFLTGKRRSELLRLTWGDIEPWVFVEEGKQRAGFRFKYFAKGRGSELQYQELPRMAYQSILNYLRESRRLDCIAPGDAIFVPTGYGTRGAVTYLDSHAPISTNTVAYNFRRYLQLAGLGNERQLSMHSLRHTAACEHYKANPDLLLLRNFLGHESIATTQLYIQDMFGLSDPVSVVIEEKFSYLVRR